MDDRLDPRRAWEPYRPSAAAPWNLRRAGHLYRRAAFGASWPELQAAVEAGPERAVDRLLAGGTDPAFDEQSGYMADSVGRANNDQQLAGWWVYRMQASPHPLREKMTLFWHNHFATSNAKVQNARSMLGQYGVMHRHALGKFDALLHEMSFDPAMMVWLDTVQSKKGMPNENYARELMELFSLGIGNYTEADIRQAARAFTGWSVKAGKAHHDPAQYDGGEKTVMGRAGKWSAADVVNICLDQKACAPFVVGKVFRFLVSEAVTPSPELLEPLVTVYRGSGYDTLKLVETVLRSNLFFSDAAYRAKIKSPVEFVLGVVRALDGRVGASAVAAALEDLGQHLFHPPSVKGWDGGTAWLNGQTLLARQNLALALTSTEDPRFGRRTDPAAALKKYAGSGDPDAVEFFVNLFLQGDVPAESRSRLAAYAAQARSRKFPVYWTEDDAANHRVRALCHLVLTLPEFQLA